MTDTDMMALPTAKLPSWYRALAVFVGVLSIALALIVLADPTLAVALLIFFLAFALLVIGIDRLVSGITGHPFGWMGPTLSGSPGAPGQPPVGPASPPKQ